MSTHLSRLLTGLAACAAALLITAVAAEAAGKPAGLRVIDSAGKTLADHTQQTGKTKIKSRRNADCFGEGTGGSGTKTTVPGATALGIIEDGRKWDRDLNRLLVTDAFDFGLGVCGIGGQVPPATGYWYLKVNNTGSLTGGDQTTLAKGDQVLWFLIEDFNDPIPPELMLDSPVRSNEDEFEVQVWEYADDGTRSPAVGASVDGAEQPTDALGKTTVTAANLPGTLPDPAFRELQATRAGAIPSAINGLCLTSGSLDRCASHAGETIYGSRRGEKIKGTRGPDTIEAGKGRDVVIPKGGRDIVDVRGGGKDVVRCNGEADRVKADARDILRGCK